MATIALVKTTWSGTSGGPGLTQIGVQHASTGDAFTAGDAQLAVNRMRTFWGAINTMIPNDVTLQVLAEVDLYDVATGALTGTTFAAAAPAIVTGAGAGNYAGGAGFKLDWETDQIKHGRRVRGHTYVVPGISGFFDSNGAVTTTGQTTMVNAGNAFLSGLSSDLLAMYVFSRPLKTPTVRAGDTTIVTRATMKLKSAILRGRRD